MYDNKECKSSNEEKPTFDLNHYECAMHHKFEVYNDHAKCAEVEKYSILITKINYVIFNSVAVAIT